MSDAGGVRNFRRRSPLSTSLCGTRFTETPGGLCSDRAGTAKEWLRIGVSDNEILFRRPDFARHGIFRFERLTCFWKCPDEPLVIGLALNIGGRRWVRPVDAVVDQEEHEDKETADAIDRSPP